MANKTVVYTAKLKDDTKKGAKSVERSMASMAKAVGPLVTAAFGVAAIKSATDAYIRQEKAIAQLEARLKSTGNAVGFTSKELQDMAASLQKVTTFGDEATMEMQALLLTFTQISGETFVGAQEAILNVATAMDTDLKSAALQVGKALNDPTRGLDGLNRSGIQFSNTQKDLIKDLQAVGDTAGAQAIILKELEVQFGGAARAARDTLGGAIESLNAAMGDLGETIIGKGSNALGVAAGLNMMTSALSDLNEEISKIDVDALDLLLFALNPSQAAAGFFAKKIAGVSENQAGKKFGIDTSQREDIPTEFTPEGMAALNQQRIDSELALTQSLQDVFMGRAAAEIRSIQMVADAEAKTQQDRAQAGQNFFSDLRSLSQNAGREGFEIAKVAAIGETIINTRKAAMGAYSALASIPYVGPALGVAAAAAAIAAGGAQIQGITSQSYGSTSGAISGTGAGTGSSPIVTQPVQAEPTQQQGITFIIDTLIGDDEWAETKLIPLINSAGRRNVTIDSRSIA